MRAACLCTLPLEGEMLHIVCQNGSNRTDANLVTPAWVHQSCGRQSRPEELHDTTPATGCMGVAPPTRLAMARELRITPPPCRIIRSGVAATSRRMLLLLGSWEMPSGQGPESVDISLERSVPWGRRNPH